ncbi:MAG TPA: hypothetical protein VGE27_11195 [Gemmatimonas sp.]|uniref:hypothetical protein n=1 Tax=Gemmatimonas sp. TaxID=1962908 RepID=UPI002EDA7259
MVPHRTPRFAAHLRTIGAFVSRAGAMAMLGMFLVLAVACHERSIIDPDQFPSALAINIEGLPSGADADVRITGPNGFSRTLTSSDFISPVTPGRYSLRIGDVRSGGFTYAALPAQIDTTVQPGDTLRYRVRLEVATGALSVQISGLPGGVPASVRINGNGLSRVANGSVIFGDLPPGVYTVSADSVNAGGTAFRGTAPAQVTITASLTPATLVVSYTNVLGVLLLNGTGLPAGASTLPIEQRPTARLQGPLQVDRLASFGELVAVPVGSYTIAPQPVTIGTRLFTPATRSITRNIGSTVRDTVSVAYQEVTTPINLTIDNVVVTQAVQRADNGIPLITGRDALLRAFVRSDRRTTLRPIARARIYDGTTAIATLLLTPPDSGVPTVPIDGQLGTTYRTRIPADLVRAQLRVSVEVDPDSTLGEVQRGDNFWPTGGQPRSLTATTVPPFAVRFVPVLHGGALGDVTSAAQERYLAVARALWPIVQVTSDVRAAFTSSAPSLQPTDANGAWSALLNELRALKALDGAPATTHYYGVVHPPYSDGVFGLALVGTPVAVGWDRRDVGVIAAHEWGHNFGRLHAPCGDAPNVDASYPNIGAAIGLVGWNSASDALQGASTPDIMSYCSPAWVSEYSYTRALTFRQGTTASTSARPLNASAQDGLLVWGRVVNGRLIVEPGFHVVAPITPPSVSPTHMAELLDNNGRVLVRFPLDAERVSTEYPNHSASEDRQFAVVIPWQDAWEGTLDAIRVQDVRSPLIAVARHRGTEPSMALLLDARTGAAQGFIRGTNVTAAALPATRHGSHDTTAHARVLWSDGVRTRMSAKN